MSESEIFVWSKETGANSSRIETHAGDLDRLYKTFVKEALPDADDDIKGEDLVVRKQQYEAIVVVEKEQRAVGMLAMNQRGKDWELTASAVKPETRKEGTWRKLVAAAEDYAVSHGAKTIEATPGGPFREKLSHALQVKGYLPVGGDETVLRKTVSENK